MQSQFVHTNGVRLHVLQDGDASAPLLILLHGFPEQADAWRKYIPRLAAAGYRVWAPDLRGYNLSDKPAGIASYSLDALAADVIGLIDAAGCEQAFLVGHDWGAAVAWWLAGKHPERVERMVVINVPHGAVMKDALRNNPEQRRKSAYLLFNQLPWLPEYLARRNNWHRLSDKLTGSSRPGTFGPDDLDRYRQAWSRPGAFTAMLNWYRAMLRKPPTPPADPRISVPTLLIWGARDAFLGKEMAQPSIDLCDDGRLLFIDDATHWVHHEETDAVSEAIIRHLKASEAAAPGPDAGSVQELG